MTEQMHHHPTHNGRSRRRAAPPQQQQQPRPRRQRPRSDRNNASSRRQSSSTSATSSSTSSTVDVGVGGRGTTSRSPARARSASSSSRRYRGTDPPAQSTTVSGVGVGSGGRSTISSSSRDRRHFRRRFSSPTAYADRSASFRGSSTSTPGGAGDRSETDNTAGGGSRSRSRTPMSQRFSSPTTYADRSSTSYGDENNDNGPSPSSDVGSPRSRSRTPSRRSRGASSRRPRTSPRRYSQTPPPRRRNYNHHNHNHRDPSPSATAGAGGRQGSSGRRRRRQPRHRSPYQQPRSSSWDGRTKHYDPNRLKTARAVSPGDLRSQLDGFDLNAPGTGGEGSGDDGKKGTTAGRSKSFCAEDGPGRSGATAGRSKSFGGIGRRGRSIGGSFRKAAARGKSPFKRRGDRKEGKSNSFIAQKVMPLVTGKSRKKKKREREGAGGRTKAAAKKGDGDGSATYFSDGGSSSSSSRSYEPSSYYSSSEEEEDGSYSEDDHPKSKHGNINSRRKRTSTGDEDYPSEEEESYLKEEHPKSKNGSNNSRRRRTSTGDEDYSSEEDESYLKEEHPKSKNGTINSRRRRTSTDDNDYSSEEEESYVKEEHPNSKNGGVDSRRRSVVDEDGSHAKKTESGNRHNGEEDEESYHSCSDSDESRGDSRRDEKSYSLSGASSSRHNDVQRNESARIRRDGSNRECRSRSSGRSGNNNSQRQLALLSDENDELRAKVVALRAEFEAMLRQVNSIGEEQSCYSCNDSIATDDDSRVSSCIQRIEKVKSSAMEKLQDKRRKSKAKADRNIVNATKEGSDVTFYKECIDDLLCENERLYTQVVTLSQEREDILQEVHDLRTSRHVNSQLKDEQTTRTHNQSVDDAATSIQGIGAPHNVMPKEEDGADEEKQTEKARTPKQAVDDVAALLQGIGATFNAVAKEEDGAVQERRSDKEIMQLVNKVIFAQRDSNTHQGENDSIQETEKRKEGEAGGQGGGISKVGVDDEQRAERVGGEENGRDNVCRRGRSEHSNRGGESVSACTFLTGSTYDDEAGYSETTPYVVNQDGHASTNSLFDASSPYIVDPEGRGENGDANDASALEIIYEYDKDDSELGLLESVPQSYRSKVKRISRTSSSPTYRDYEQDSYDDESFRYEGEEGCSSNDQGSKSTSRPFLEDVELPPSGYHRYSPSPSRHSQHLSRNSSSTTRQRSHHSLANSSSESSDAVRRHCRRGQSLYSNRSSSGSSKIDRRSRRSKSFNSHRPSDVTSNEERAMTASERERTPKVQSHHDEFSAATEDKHDGKLQINESIPSIDNPNWNQEDRLANAIESHLDSTLLTKPIRDDDGDTLAPSCASVSDASTPFSCADETYRSISGESTKERRGICITVVSRASRYVMFPSSQAHTYVTHFRADLSKTQVDAVLEEQFLEASEMFGASSATPRRTNCEDSKVRKKKYQGEFNEEGERHGYGICTSRNGNEYRGEWHEDKREGLGVVSIGNGDIFEGQFEGNYKNGIGVYHFLDGECDLSRYVDDVRVGNSIRYSKDRLEAFLLSEDTGDSKAISLEEAARVAKEMGTVVAY